MVKEETKLPKPVETYVRAINARDADAFPSSFAHDAVVKDVGREIRGRRAQAFAHFAISYSVRSRA
jgi:hypothetical protein